MRLSGKFATVCRKCLCRVTFVSVMYFLNIENCTCCRCAKNGLVSSLRSRRNSIALGTRRREWQTRTHWRGRAASIFTTLEHVCTTLENTYARLVRTYARLLRYCPGRRRRAPRRLDVERIKNPPKLATRPTPTPRGLVSVT